MIIKVGKISLLPWFYEHANCWTRVSPEGSPEKGSAKVELQYNTLFGMWWPKFRGDSFYLTELFNEYPHYGRHKHKHHLLAMEQMDRFLIRMGKLAYFT